MEIYEYVFPHIIAYFNAAIHLCIFVKVYEFS